MPVLTRPLLRALGLGALVLPLQAIAGVLEGTSPVFPAGSSALNLFTWLGTFLFLVGAINQVMRLVDWFRAKPPISEVYLTKEQAQLSITQLRHRDEEIEGRIEAVSAARDSDRAEVRDDLSALRSDLAADIRRIHERLDNLPAQMVATLSNTGAFNRGGR